mmetsp:Transcript_132660/g.412508  ORF Transcript_132660/g.412508 Transcript_132660/m.412508 type:complete len:297 (+) Transcript_132660:900-1790(+)
MVVLWDFPCPAALDAVASGDIGVCQVHKFLDEGREQIPGGDADVELRLASDIGAPVSRVGHRLESRQGRGMQLLLVPAAAHVLVPDGRASALLPALVAGVDEVHAMLLVLLVARLAVLAARLAHDEAPAVAAQDPAAQGGCLVAAIASSRQHVVQAQGQANVVPGGEFCKLAEVDEAVPIVVQLLPDILQAADVSAQPLQNRPHLGQVFLRDLARASGVAVREELPHAHKLWLDALLLAAIEVVLVCRMRLPVDVLGVPAVTRGTVLAHWAKRRQTGVRAAAAQHLSRRGRGPSGA